MDRPDAAGSYPIAITSGILKGAQSPDFKNHEPVQQAEADIVQRTRMKGEVPARAGGMDGDELQLTGDEVVRTGKERRGV